MCVQLKEEDERGHEAGEMPEGPARPNHELRDRARRPPVLPRPPGRRRARTDLRRTSRGNPGGRGALSRACVQVGRPRHARLVRGASQPHLQRGPRGGLVHNQQLLSMHRRQTELTCEGTRAGRAGVGHGERTGRRVRCSSTRAPRLTLTRGRRRGVWTGHPAGVCLPGSAYVSNLQQEERQRTVSHGQHGHHGHP